ncbi:MAG: hypothetical protein RIT81_16520 [Deltaproteobacteria bacterium]
MSSSDTKPQKSADEDWKKYGATKTHDTKEMPMKPTTEIDVKSSLPRLYQFTTLSCLVDLVEAVYADYFERPERYQTVKTVVDAVLAFGSVGTSHDQPDHDMRRQRSAPYFGESDTDTASNDSAFGHLGRDLRDAARQYTERNDLSAADTYLEAAGEAARALHEYLEQKQVGRGLEVTFGAAEKQFGRVVEILHGDIRGAFAGAGGGPGKGSHFPLRGTDGGGERLVSRMAEDLAEYLEEATYNKLRPGHLTQVLRIADYGGRTLEAVSSLDVTDQQARKVLIALAYNWDKAIRAFHA